MDAYKIGVSIALNSNGLGVLGALANGMQGLDRAVLAATGKMNALKVAALGAIGAVAGIGTLRAMSHLVEKGAELVHQQDLLRRQGLDGVQIAAATARAWQTVRDVQGTKVADNLKMFGELRSQVSSDQQALAILPDLARMGTLLQNETGKAPERMAQTMMRVLEMRGQIFGADGHTMDLEKVRSELAMAYQAMSASHGLVTPQTFLGFQQQAGPAGMALSPEAYYRTMPTAMQTMGGNRAGTAMASLFAQFMGGVMTQRVASELEKLGLMDESKVHVRRGGQVTVDPGAVKGFDPSNPFAFFNGAFREAVGKQGGNAGEKLEGVLDPTMVQEMYRSLGRETTRRLVSEFIQLAPTFERDFRLRQQTMTPEAANAESQHDPNRAMTNFTSAWTNLQTALGAPLVDVSVRLLGRLTDALNALGQWASANPGMVQQIGMATGALAALIGVGGLLAVGGAAMAALGVLAGPVGLAGLAVAILAMRAALGGGDADRATPGERLRAGVGPAKPDWTTQLGAMLPKEGEWLPAIAKVGGRIIFAVVDTMLNVGTAMGHEARKLFDTAASEVISGLGRVSSAILAWIGGLPGAALGAMKGWAAATFGAENPASHEPNHGGGRGSRAGIAPLNPIQPQSYVPPAANTNMRPIQVHAVMMLDGREVGRAVTTHQSREASGPARGITNFDLRETPMQPGAGAVAI